jgi:hypothetical protein
MPCDGFSTEADRGASSPFGLRNGIRLGRHVVIEDELANPRAFGDTPNFGHIGVERSHSVKGGTRESMLLEIAEVRDAVDEDVGVTGKPDQIVVHSCIAGEHDGALRGAEPVREGRHRPAVRHRRRRDSNVTVFENDSRGRPDTAD